MRKVAVIAIALLVAASLTLTGCHKLGLVKSPPKTTPSSASPSKSTTP